MADGNMINALPEPNEPSHMTEMAAGSVLNLMHHAPSRVGVLSTHRANSMKVSLVRPLRPNGRDERSSIRQDRSYDVLAIECEMFRLVNQFGEPTLHDSEAFDIADSTEPEFWIHTTVDGWRYSGPAGWNRPGFFEDWHDGIPDARDKFHQDVLRYYPQVVADLGHSRPV